VKELWSSCLLAACSKQVIFSKKFFIDEVVAVLPSYYKRKGAAEAFERMPTLVLAYSHFI